MGHHLGHPLNGSKHPQISTFVVTTLVTTRVTQFVAVGAKVETLPRWQQLE